MRWIPFLIIVLLISCGKKKEDKISASSIEEEFRAAAASRGISYSRTTQSINIVGQATMDSITSSKNSNVAGFCLCPTGGKVCNIYLRSDIWSNANDKSRREMLFHELGHCNLVREHNSNAINIGNGTTSNCIFPVSIMYPVLLSTSCSYNNVTPNDFVANHWGDYVNQLFLGDQTSLQKYGSIYTPGGSSGGGRPAIVFNKLTQKQTQTDPPLEKEESDDDLLNHLYAYKIKKIDDCTYEYSDSLDDE